MPSFLFALIMTLVLGDDLISFINRLDRLVSFTCAFILFHIVNFFFHINKRVVNDRIK